MKLAGAIARAAFWFTTGAHVPIALALVATGRERAAVVVLAIAAVVIPPAAGAIDRWAPRPEHRNRPVAERRALAAFAAGLAYFWFPGLLALAVVAIAFSGVARARRPWPWLLGTGVIALGWMRFSGGFTHGARGPIDAATAFQLVLVTVPYLAIVGRERFARARWMTLLLFAIALVPHALIFHFAGANTPWLTNFVESQPGLHQLRGTDRAIVAPRSVMPSLHGLLVQDHEGRAFSLDGEGRPLCSSPLPAGPSTGAFCALEAPGLCYLPRVGSGLSLLDPLNCAEQVIAMEVEAHDRLLEGPGRVPAALARRDGGQLVPLRFATRDDIEPLPMVDLQRSISGWTGSTVQVDDEGTLVIARTRAGRLQIHSLQLDSLEGDRLEGEATELLLETNLGSLPAGADAFVVRGDRIVYGAWRGTVYVFDWSGSQLHEIQLGPRFLRLIHDATRDLTYTLDSFGFVTILDTRSSEVRRAFFAGFYVRNLLFAEGQLYVASSAGLFRIDVDEALAASETMPSG